jgi:flavin reductase (DIM6/NTAB) family NADH-FMN oxidoreductase RutF
MTEDNRVAIDAVFRLVDREVWVVTSAAGAGRGGLLATWVSQGSIDDRHPVIVAGIAPNHHTAKLIDSSGAFAAHLLRGDQSELAWNFCRDSGSQRDKLAGLPLATHELPGSADPRAGVPVLQDCLAWLGCRVFYRVATGDRIYYWADVVAGRQVTDGQPLREQSFFQSADDDRRQLLARRRLQDIQVQHRAWNAWKAQLPRIPSPASDPPVAGEP